MRVARKMLRANHRRLCVMVRLPLGCRRLRAQCWAEGQIRHTTSKCATNSKSILFAEAWKRKLGDFDA
eukprot:CAMPEP_0203985850 /NCGR_PEP_ID=MMETSP0360-20130528/5589_1 /ASSEMBLY_ACC=CAM_ASM_000342 /TAXON_ID=268821 /ORGANISM="Scrippsiella Hangoei, Strain SHTV-5" /LENGTH=67 /DNA_ID=CAMNT_0050925171 /DNA_START=102 /DNA_END=302 /DNA_ORIENTATION=-